MTDSSTTRIPFTPSKFAELQAEKTRLTTERKAVLIRLQEAREQGDLSENGAYHYAKFELGNIGRQLRELNHQLSHGYVVKPAATTGTITFGNTITLQSETNTLTFMLVSEYESNPSEHKLSTTSPVGQAVIGKKKGDRIEVTLPKGLETYVILSVE